MLEDVALIEGNGISMTCRRNTSASVKKTTVAGSSKPGGKYWPAIAAIRESDARV